MRSENIDIREFLRQAVAFCLTLSMLLPTAAQVLDILSDSAHRYQVMTLDQQEESQKEEQQEDTTKDEKMEMRYISTSDYLGTKLSRKSISKSLDGASDFILEIPIPPPERS